MLLKTIFWFLDIKPTSLYLAFSNLTSTLKFAPNIVEAKSGIPTLLPPACVETLKPGIFKFLSLLIITFS